MDKQRKQFEKWLDWNVEQTEAACPSAEKKDEWFAVWQAAIAAAEQAQAEPVAWHTNDSCVSGEHIEAIAKVCKIIPSYTTAEYVASIVGFGHVLLADKSVQEAFVRANSHLLRTDPAQLPAVAVPEELTDEIEQCSMVMHYLGATDADDIESDTFEIIGEDEQGRDAYADVSIVEWAGRTATLLDKIAAAQKGGA